MPRMMPIRILIVVVLAVPATLATLALASPAGARTYESCNSLSGLNLSGQRDTLAGCTGPTGGSGTFIGPVASPMTVTWAGGGTTTFDFTTKFPKKSACSVGSTELSLRGHAKISTGPAKRIRGMFFAKVCLEPNEHLSLLPGKPMQFLD
jgi:hypothetical protein